MGKNVTQDTGLNPFVWKLDCLQQRIKKKRSNSELQMKSLETDETDY